MVERNLNRWTIFFSVLFVLNAIILLKRPWACKLALLSNPDPILHG